MKKTSTLLLILLINSQAIAECAPGVIFCSESPFANSATEDQYVRKAYERKMLEQAIREDVRRNNLWQNASSPSNSLGAAMERGLENYAVREEMRKIKEKAVLDNLFGR